MKVLGGVFGGGLLCILSLCYSVHTFAAVTEKAIVEQSESQRFWKAWNARAQEILQHNLATPDPWEPLNRKIYAFNDVVDRYFLTPVAKGYQWVTPDPVEKGVGNVFANLTEVSTIANNLLQFKFSQAASDTGRFVINTTVGLAGIFDVASSMGLERHYEDFGQTLGYWGVGAGPYVVAPLLGSFTVRDGFGAYGDAITTDVVGQIDHVRTRNSIRAVNLVDKRASLFAAEKLISGDRYTFIRDAYLQRREFLVKDGAVEDSFGEDDFDDDW